MNKTQFFKYLSDGGRVEMISWQGGAVPERLKGVRYAEKVQTNAIKFNNGSWLAKNDVKASDISEVFTGNDQPSINLGWVIYKLVKENN